MEQVEEELGSVFGQVGGNYNAVAYKYFYLGFRIPAYKENKYKIEWFYAPMIKPDKPVTVEI